MSETVAAIRGRVRSKVRDNDSRRESFSDVDYDMTIAEKYLEFDARLSPPQLYAPNAFTIAAGADTFTLPTTSAAQYAQDIQIQLVSNLFFLRKLTIEDMNLVREGIRADQMSIPDTFAIWEDSAQVIQGRVSPRSRAAEVCNFFGTILATDLRTAANMDAASILFNRWTAAALVYLVAAEMAECMTPEDLALRRLNPAVVSSWVRAGETIMYREEARRGDLRNTGRVHRHAS